MPNVLAMSFEGDLAPSFDLRCLAPGKKPPDGWGIGYYPGGEPSAAVLKEPAPPVGSIRSDLIKAWETLASPIFLLHIRKARWGHISDANTQPFSRSWGRRDWLFAHGGSLTRRLTLSEDARFEPVGATDTELVFCELMSRIAARGWKSLGEADLPTLRGWLAELGAYGVLSCVLTDGLDLCVYADAGGEGKISVWELLPPYQRMQFGDEDLWVDLTKRGITSRKGVIFTTKPLARSNGHGEEPEPVENVPWRTVAPGHLLVVRQGVIRVEVVPPESSTVAVSGGPAIADRREHRLEKSERRTLSLTHRTVYRYARPVERSMHLLRLIPVHDHLQTLFASDILVSLDGKPMAGEGPGRDFEDVFGNRVRRLSIDTPFQELRLEAHSRVELLDTDPLGFRPLRVRSSIPLVWMPWQRHMLQPFLLPQELPDSELHELVEYAMSFVKRNDFDLLDTLLDLNTTIFKEYEYRQGVTNLSTTPFDVYANRRGVCQDFANLFI